MISKSKYELDDSAIKNLFRSAGIEGVEKIAPLGAGEYNAVYAVSAGGVEYVIKIAPLEKQDMQTYERGMMRAELFWYGKMRECTDIHTPKVYYSDFTRTVIPCDWFIMEKAEGLQMDKLSMSRDEKEYLTRKIAEMSAKIHEVKNDTFGYLQNGQYSKWHDAISSIVRNLLNDAARKGKRSKRGEKLLAMLHRYADELNKAEPCMINFDAWMPNFICKRETDGIKCTWIDPERGFWGDRICDFICFEFLKPLADKKVSLGAYNKTSSVPVVIDRNTEIRYAAALGVYGLIMDVERHYRYTPRHFGWWRNFFACSMLYRSAFKTLKQ